MNKKKANICLCLSDLHFGHESCLYDTYHYTITKLLEELKMLQSHYVFETVFLILNGDIVSGTMIYRNQYLESQINKNEYIIMFGAYMIHLLIEKIEETIGQPIRVFMIAGNHEVGRIPLPHNFSVGIARRLNSYGDDVRYTSNYLILDISRNLDIHVPKYNICAFHSWGSADYSSASPSVVREMTTIQSLFSAHKGIIIQRFLVGHSHWLEIGRTALGVTWDVCGGFMMWSKKISFRESGMLYYILNEDNDFDVRPISGLKQQIKEMEKQNLHFRNLRYVSNVMIDAMQFEIDLGLLQEPKEGEEMK